MSHRLADSVMAAIVAELRACEAVQRAALFGSRAMNTARANSDVDIAVWGPLELLDLARLSGAMLDLPIPWRVDLVHVHAGTHPPLVAHIERVGVALFERENAAA